MPPYEWINVAINNRCLDLSIISWLITFEQIKRCFLSFLQTADCVGGHNHKPTSHRTSPAEFIGFADGINSSPLIYLRAATRIPAVTIACASRTAFHMNFAVLIIFSQYLTAVN